MLNIAKGPVVEMNSWAQAIHPEKCLFLDIPYRIFTKMAEYRIDSTEAELGHAHS